MSVEVRDAVADDLPAIRRIYAYHVENGYGSFETEAPTLADIGERYRAIVAAQLPYLVAERDGNVIGYAYASRFRPRAAYAGTVENSVYVDRDAQRRGIGRALLEGLMERCAALGLEQMIAVIGDTGNAGSIALHSACGFRHVGTLESVGRKFDRWVDVVLMQRALQPQRG
jgi:phosphinothricin acetyltransferase